MAKEFKYKPKGIQITDIAAVVVALAFIIGPIVYPFGIGIRGKMLLPYPYSMYVLMALGVCLLIFQVMRLRKEAKLREVARPIIVDGDNVSFVKISGKGIEECTIKISEVTKVDYDKEDEVLTVVTPAGRFKFDKDYFETSYDFDEFSKLFIKS